MQNRIHYFRWTTGLIVVTNSFLTGTKNDKYGSHAKLSEIGDRHFEETEQLSVNARNASFHRNEAALEVNC